MHISIEPFSTLKSQVDVDQARSLAEGKVNKVVCTQPPSDADSLAKQLQRFVGCFRGSLLLSVPGGGGNIGSAPSHSFRASRRKRGVRIVS